MITVFFKYGSCEGRKINLFPASRTLVFTYYRHETDTRGSFISAMSIQRADFRLRTETLALLEL